MTRIRCVKLTISICLLFVFLALPTTMAFPDSSKTLRIMPMGDSITQGAAVPGGYRQPLYDLLIKNGHKVDFVGAKTQQGDTCPDPDHWGQSGWQISKTPVTIDGDSYVSIQGENRSGLYEEVPQAISTAYFSTDTSTTRNIILLQIGINDILHQVVDSKHGSFNSDAGNDGRGEGQEWIAEGCLARLQAMLRLINSKAASNDLRIEVIIGTLCPLTKDWTGDPVSDVLINEVMEYNKLISAIIPTMTFTNLDVKIVDHHAASAGKLADGLHPNRKGYEAMAQVWYDGITIHRTVLDDKVMASRFHREGESRIIKPQPEVMPQLDDIPEGRVLLQLSEGLPAHDRWLNEGEQWPAESIRWAGDTFLLRRIPLQYDAWGIRSGWKAPVLLRMVGDVELPAGTHRFLLRARSQSRLWIDGKIVARTQPVTKRPPDGEEPVTPVAEAPLDGVRIHGYHQQEVFGEATIEPDVTGQSRVVLELVVGGEGHRTETGEVCVAMLSADGKSYDVIGPGLSRLPLTDAAVEPILSSMEKSRTLFDDQRRRSAAVSQNGFWQRRHEFARTWAKTESTPVANDGDHPIDGFITSKVERAVSASAAIDVQQAEHFHGKVLPILREQCFRCHGEKDKGGLKLDSREALLKAGDSEILAVVPGDLDASELIARIRSGDMPPTEEGLSKQQIELLEQWVTDGAAWPATPLTDVDVAMAPVIDDAAFLRRIYLDTIGVPPSEDEARVFLGESAVGPQQGRDVRTLLSRRERRQKLIDHLLEDERFADGWMNFWLDLLAENPTLINASLNSTGPFRWFLHDSLRDNKSLDRMVTELIMMRGGAAEGGSAGFGIAAENDAPLAAKGHIVASAFLGIDLKCARCHDSPYHNTTQKDLYSLAAMFNRQPVTVPKTSQVPAAFFENQEVRKSLIQVTLEANASVRPEWPFATVTGVSDGSEIDRLTQNPADTRERLAALVTAPQNIRFARVIVNRIWKRLMGAGLVEPVHDWEGNTASHPELLDWLARELVTNDYDLRHVVRLIVTSDTYQRTAVGKNLAASAPMRFFNAPERRRLSAEQIVDSLHQATGQPIDAEELTFVHDGRRELGQRQTLGKPTRAWMFGDLKNERDRPSLSLPRARAIVDVLEAFGWNGARQMPIVERETDPNVLQPGVLAGGTLSVSLTRASYESEMANLAVAATSPQLLVESMFLRCLSRWPKPDERQAFADALSEGFDARLVPADRIAHVEEQLPLPQVTWFNHGQAKANEIQLEIERRVLAGPPPDPRLSPEWRVVYEDALWSLVNHREFVWMP